VTGRVSGLRPASRAICRFSLIASVRSRIALNRLSNTVPVVLHFIRFQPPPTPNRKRWFDT
jgi:hypothetical protein